MKEHKIDVMDEGEEKLSNVLQHFGFSNAVAKTLIYMLNKKTGHSKEIEHSMDLRQPEVSLATTELRHLGILDKKNIPLEGKGRPLHRYILKKSSAEIMKIIEGKAQAKIKSLETNLKDLRDLITELEK